MPLLECFQRSWRQLLKHTRKLLQFLIPPLLYSIQETFAIAKVPNQNEPPFKVKNDSTSIWLAPVDKIGAVPSVNFAPAKVANLLPVASCRKITVQFLEIPEVGGLVNVKATFAPSVISKMFDKDRSMLYVDVVTRSYMR